MLAKQSVSLAVGVVATGCAEVFDSQCASLIPSQSILFAHGPVDGGLSRPNPPTSLQAIVNVICKINVALLCLR